MTKTISTVYTDEDLCNLHDQYMHMHEDVVDTDLNWILRANYTQLIAGMNPMHDMVASRICAFMLIYKQNVYHIDQANDKRMYGEEIDNA